ncbi:MAG: hypothetical protein K6G61_02940 [Solobacterium sp.]|nr:hypothetical protein [Solobacterium sp.]
MSTNETKKITENRSRILSIPAILTRTLLRWKLILLCGVLFAAAGAGLSYRKQAKQAAPESETEQVKTDLTSDEYYEKMIKAFDQAIIDRYEYMAATLVDGMDPYSNATAEAVLFVESPYTMNIAEGVSEIATGDVNGNMLSTTISRFIRYGIDWSSIKEEIGIEDDVLLNELVGVDNSSNIITVTIQSPDQEMADKMLTLVIDQSTEKFKDLIRIADLESYKIMVMDRNVTNRIYSSNFNWLTTRLSEIQSFTNAKTSFENEYNKSGLLTSAEETVSTSSIVKRGILMFIIGLLFSACAVLLYLYASAKVLSAAELNDTYGLRSLSVMGPKAKGLSAAILRILPENRSTLSEDARYELAGSYADELVEEGSSIGIVSDLPAETVAEITDHLNRVSEHAEYTALSGIRDNVEDRKKLSKVDYVILAAGTEKSSYAAVNDLLTLTTNYKKPLVGTITL